MVRPKGSQDRDTRKRVSLWSPEQLEYLRDHYYEMSNQELGNRLNKSKSSILKRAKELGLERKPQQGRGEDCLYPSKLQTGFHTKEFVQERSGTV